MIEDPLLFMASQTLQSLARMPRDQGDFEHALFESTLSESQRGKRPEDRLAPAGRSEVNLLLAYLRFVNLSNSRTNLADLPVEVHAWFLERLKLGPAVMCRKWRTSHREFFDARDQEAFTSFSVDGILVRPFWDLRSSLCRHRVVQALLEFDTYNRLACNPPLPGNSCVSQLWRAITRTALETSNLRKVTDTEQRALLIELTDIVIDEVQQRPKDAAAVLASIATFLRNTDLPEGTYHTFQRSVRERARLAGGTLGQEISETLGQYAESW